MFQILKVIVGSRAHGLANADSDTDFRGVFITPTKELLKLGGTTQQTSWIEGKEDDTSWELGKFLLMATKCNPTILEVFMAPRTSISDDGVWTTESPDNSWGDRLIALFPHVWNSTDAFNAFRGYGKNQQKKFLDNKDVRPHKYAVAYLRTLYNAVQLLETGTFSLDTSDTPIYETLRRWKNKDYTVGEVMQVTHDWDKKVIDAYEKCEKKETNMEPINGFLLEMRQRFWE